MNENFGTRDGQRKGFVIAVDGPAASGKGTIARALASHYGLPHMDTGLLYRAVALKLWRWGGDASNEFEALRACDDLGFDPSDEELTNTALCAHLGACGHEQLGMGVRSDDGSDVAPIEHRPTLLGDEVALPLQERVADRRIR